eukprot:762975-Hanusia_phi.AAC.6
MGLQTRGHGSWGSAGGGGAAEPQGRRAGPRGAVHVWKERRRRESDSRAGGGGSGWGLRSFLDASFRSPAGESHNLPSCPLSTLPPVLVFHSLQLVSSTSCLFYASDRISSSPPFLLPSPALDLRAMLSLSGEPEEATACFRGVWAAGRRYRKNLFFITLGVDNNKFVDLVCDLSRLPQLSKEELEAAATAQLTGRQTAAAEQRQCDGAMPTAAVDVAAEVRRGARTCVGCRPVAAAAAWPRSPPTSSPCATASPPSSAGTTACHVA